MADTSYTLCVTADSTVPVASRGRGCISFATAPAPAVGALTVAAVAGTSPAQWQVSLAFARSVSSIVYTYTAAGDLPAARAYLTAQGSAVSESDPAVKVMTAYAQAAGFSTQLTTLLYKGGADETSFVSRLLPSGALTVCAFGVSATGQAAVSCTPLTVPAVVLTDSAATDLLASGTRSGDATESLSTINYVAKSTSSSSSTRRGLQSSGVTSTLISTTLTVAGQVVSGGSNLDLMAAASTLAGTSSLIGASGTSAQHSQCSSTAASILQEVNRRGIALSGPVTSNILSTLLACKMSLDTALNTVGSLAVASTGSSTFSSVSSTAGIVGSIGTQSTPLTVSSGAAVQTVSVSSLISFADRRARALQAGSVANPTLIVATSSSVALPRNAANQAVVNVTQAVKVLALGLPART